MCQSGLSLTPVPDWFMCRQGVAVKHNGLPSMRRNKREQINVNYVVQKRIVEIHNLGVYELVLFVGLICLDF